MIAASRDELGLIWLGSADAAARPEGVDSVFREVLIVPGGSVWIDVRTPADLSAVVDDLDAAGWWLEHLLGADAAQAAFDLHADATVRSVEVEPSRTELAASASRLLELLWLRRWWPEPVNEWMIDAEIGALVWNSEDLLGDLTLATAVLQSDEVRVELTKNLAQIAAREGAVDVDTHPVARTLKTAARAALDATEVDDVHEQLRQAYAALARVEEDVRDAIDLLIASAQLELDRVRELVTVGASTMAWVAGDDRLPAGRIPIHIDPRAVQPRSVDYEMTSHVELEHADDGLVATVRVQADTASFRDADDVLIAELVTDDERHEVRLRRESSSWVGSVTLSGRAAPSVAIRSVRYDLSARPDLRDLSVDEVRNALVSYKRDRRRSPASDPFVFELAPLSY